MVAVPQALWNYDRKSDTVFYVPDSIKLEKKQTLQCEILLREFSGIPYRAESLLMFKKIKGFFVVLLALLIGFAVVSFFSLRGERDQLETCKRLGVECEAGKMHRFLEEGKSFSDELWKKLLKKLRSNQT